jgi:peroxin-5
MMSPISHCSNATCGSLAYGSAVQWSPCDSASFSDDIPTSPTSSVKQGWEFTSSSLSQPSYFPPVSWDEEFLALTRSLQQEPTAEPAQPIEKLFDGDELARTAGMLVDAVKEESNPKFKSSAFLSFMRQVRDKEVVVDGNDLVRVSDATTTTSSVAQSRPTNAPIGMGPHQRSVVDTSQYNSTFGQRRKSVHFESTQDAVVSMDGGEEDTYWERENREYAAYWGEAEESKGASSARLIVPPLQEQGLQGKEWDTLQGSWDQWEATATGVKRVYEYHFQENNPYLIGQSSTTSHHTSHGIVEQVSGIGMVVGGTD